MDRPEKRVDDLRQRISHHQHRYYVLDDPEISDAAFDALFRELQTLEEQHPQLFDPNSPHCTRRRRGRRALRKKCGITSLC